MGKETASSKRKFPLHCRVESRPLGFDVPHDAPKAWLHPRHLALSRRAARAKGQPGLAFGIGIVPSRFGRGEGCGQTALTFQHGSTLCKLSPFGITHALLDHKSARELVVPSLSILVDQDP